MAGFGTSKDELLLAELLAGASVKDAAAAVGIGERTARRHVADPGFRARLDDARREIVTVVVARLSGLADEAVTALRELIVDAGTPAQVRLNAVRVALDSLERLGVAPDLARELAELRQLVDRALGRAAA